MNKSETKAYAMLISSMLIFGTIGVFRRYIPVSSALLACMRGLIGSGFLLLVIKLKGRGQGAKITLRQVWFPALIGALIGINWILLFESYNYTTVATATLCYYMEPTIVILLSPLALRERLTLKKILCALVAILGMVFVSGIADGEMGNGAARGIIFGLGAAAIYAAVVILNKKVKLEDAYGKTVIQLFFAAVVIIPYLLLTENFSEIQLDAASVILIITVGILHTGIAYALYFASMDVLKAQSIAIISYADPVFALLLSAVFLKERMTLAGIIGAILIIGSALISECRFGKKGEK